MTQSASIVASLCLVLDRQLPTPLFRQLYSGLREAILSGHLEGGTRLPPTRELAEELEVSRNTVVNAFEQLIAEGYLEGKVGAGTYVTSILPEDVFKTNIDVRNASSGVPMSGAAISRWGASLTAKSVVPIRYARNPRAFQPGVPAIDRFPFDLWAKLTARCWRHPARELLSYGDPHGYWPLREAIAGYLKASRGMKCEPEQVIIMAGSQQALDLTARVLLDPGDAMWIEDPGYLGARHVFAGLGVRLVPVEVDKDGLNVEEGIRRCPDVRLAYVTPSHQYPLGVTMSLARRLALLEWATRTGAWVLEDDYDSEYRYEGRPLAALQGLDNTGRVIYMGTFSKVLLPALRLGYLVVPPALVDTFVQARSIADRHSPSLDQMILTEFMNEGHFARHIRRMKHLYVERQAVLIEAARQKLDGLLQIQPSTTGLHVVGWLPPRRDDRLASQHIQCQGVDTPPLSAYHIAPPQRSGLVLGYAGVEPQAIRTAVEHIARALS
ncbi:PLP-dependent aminotransferase family protein [Ktedonobacter robiniae]|uniref:Transcriptional regulator n=1 Tax=Ktedonobacter robiniae TaxID=2778365 RepID=A0ABQ3V6K8_9CHLR|nr:PLP-dependent aminotransferase family protein [Ktedonobacter robiniae]GHO60604.1 transcriptional regulator [Ktedonobacter robiniae]